MNGLERWNSDIELLNLGMKQLLMNEFEQAEATFTEGKSREPPVKDAESRDIRSIFAMMQALLSAAQGIANLGEEQMKECYERLLSADKMAQQTDEWLGKKAIRGLCLICIGLIEVAQKKYVKGLMNIYRSYKFIKILGKEGLEYEGKEASIVRSTALYALGNYFVANSFMPENGSKISAWLSGLKGDRKAGEEMVLKCFQDDGICAPWAAISYITFNINTKTFIGETMSEADHNNVKSMFAYAENKYPNSVFFTLSKIGYHAYARNTEESVKLCIQSEPHFKLPVLKYSLYHNHIVALWGRLEFLEAGEVAEKGLQIFIDGGKQSMVPSVSISAYLSYAQHLSTLTDTNERNALIERMNKFVTLANECANSDKKKWPPPDRAAFRLFKKYASEENESGSDSGKDVTPAKNKPKKSKKKKSKETSFAGDKWVLLDLAETMVNVVRCTYFMTHEYLHSFQDLILQEFKAIGEDNLSAGDKVKTYMLLVEINKQLNDFEQATVFYEKAQLLEPLLTDAEKQDGYFPVILYYIAAIHINNDNIQEADKLLSRIRKYGKKFKTYSMIALKLTILQQKIGVSTKDKLIELKVPARSEKGLFFDLEQASADQVVSWSWSVKEYNINFRAIVSKVGENKTVQTFSKEDTEDEVLLGEYRVEQDDVGLELKFDNSFSYLKSKTVTVRVSPEELTVAEH